MYKYLLLNLVFMTVVALAATRLPLKKLRTKKTLVVLAIMLAMTAVFDSLIVALNLVNYDHSHILGLYIGKAPIEDFGYTIIAATLVPLLWEQGSKNDQK